MTTQPIPLEGGKSWLVAGLLSLLIPGAGDIYNGRVGRGIATFFFCLVLVVVSVGLLAIVVWPAAALQSALMASGTARCPFCKSYIDRKAVRCRHCASDLFVVVEQPVA